MGRRPSCSCRGLCLNCGSNWCGSLQHFYMNELELCRLDPNYNIDKYYNHYSDSHNNCIRQNAAHTVATLALAMVLGVIANLQDWLV